MGCAQSRVDNEEAVTRCKERRLWMMAAVAARNAFAAAHFAYVVAIKDTGAALSEFGQSETPDPGSSSSAGDLASRPVGAVPPVHPPVYNLPPPPPPLPDFSASSLQRSVSMPDLPKKFPPKVQSDASIREDDDEGEDEAHGEEDEDEDADGDGGLEHRRRPAGVAMGSPSPSPSPAPPPPPPQQSLEPAQVSKAMGTLDYIFFTDNMQGPSLTPTNEVRHGEDGLEERFNTSASAPSDSDHCMVGDGVDQVTPKKVVLETPMASKVPRKSKQGGNAHHQHVASASSLDVKKVKMVPNSRISLQKLLTDLDDLFLKVSESTHEVSKMLEATKMHYHSNFADSRGHIDHSARIMRVITWNRSFKGIPDPDGIKDDFDNDEEETHATVLDKILAWERKLYDEVKAGELMKIEYQKNVASLNRQKKRGASIGSLERTKAAVSHLHSRYIVDMQSMDSTVSEIQRLRDKQLYPRLVELIEGMARMWEVMHMHHYTQLKMVEDLKALEVSYYLIEMTEHHYKCTLQLLTISKEWHSQFNKLCSYQREYVEDLTNWLKLSLSPIESSLKEKVSSPERPAHAPIQSFLNAWHENLPKLPDALAKSAIFSFSEAIGTIVILHQEELKQWQKCEELQKDYLRKNRSFEDWFRKYSEKKMASTVGEPVNGEVANQTDPVEERNLVVQAAKSRLDEGVESHKRLSKQLREKSLSSLKAHLPELFRNMSNFAKDCATMYYSLKRITEQEKAN